MRDGEVDKRLHLVEVADVGRVEGGGVTELGGDAFAGLGVDVGDDDASTLVDQLPRGGLPDAAGAASDDRDLAGELLGLHAGDLTTVGRRARGPTGHGR